MLFAIAAAAVADETAPARVSVAPLSQVAVTLRESAPAIVVSRNRTQVASRIAGVIEVFDVQVGQEVPKGDVLAVIDCAEYRQNLASNEAQLAALEARRRLADEQLKRALKLLPTRNISEEQVNQRRAEFDAVEAEITAQRARIDNAGRQVRDCSIESPFAGVVTARLSSLGSYVSPGTPIVEILQTGSLEIKTRVPISSAEQVSRSDLVFRTDLADYPVRLRSLLPLVDETSRSREARLVFIDSTAFAGTPGRLEWVIEENAVPAHLLVSGEGSLGVFVAENGRARFVSLSGALVGRPARTELDPGALIVIDGRHTLASGQAIEVVDPS